MGSEERRGCCGVIDYRFPVIATGWQLSDSVCQQRELEKRRDGHCEINRTEIEEWTVDEEREPKSNDYFHYQMNC